MRTLLTIVTLALLATPASAGLRSPQVPVNGSALQSFLNSNGQTIDVMAHQLDIFHTNIVPNWVLSLVQAGGPVTTASFGLYNAGMATPPLYTVCPGAAMPGWSSLFSIRTLPTRLVVNLFDANNILQGTTTYLGVTPTSIGFFCNGPTDIVYSQDERNPSGQPRILVFQANGALAGKQWIAVETTPGPGADYADAIYLLSVISTVDVLPTTWGALKQRFR